MKPSQPPPRSGRAAVFTAPNAAFEIREYPLREVSPDEVLVRVRLATICRSDLHSYQGHRPHPCPGILGHEIVGVVEAIGARVGSDLRGAPVCVGDRVTWTEYFRPGSSFQRDVLELPQKAPGVRKYGHESVTAAPHFNGGFAEYCYLYPGTGIVRLPEALSDTEAAPLNCGVATMMAVTEAADIHMGDVVVVQGLGLLGLYGCAIARARGARRVIGIDTDERRLAWGTRFGADETFDLGRMREAGLIEAVRTLCPPDGPDVVLEACGVPAALPLGLRLLRAGGRYALAGYVSPGAACTLDASDLVRKCLTLHGVHNYHPRHLLQAVDFVASARHRFPFAELVDATFPLEAIDAAFARMAERSVLRAGIRP